MTGGKRHASRCCALFSLACALLLPVPAWGWNAAGHRLVASIAWNYLDGDCRSAVARFLRAHPDYPRWLAKAGTENADRDVFIEASTWPDDIRGDGRFYSAGSEAVTPLLPAFPDMERHGDWHYVNRPLDGGPVASGLLDKQLAALAKSLASARTPLPDRAYALPWLIHLVGDAHQPLHAASPLDAQGRIDSVGLTVINPFVARKNTSTLHAFWDDLPGPPWLRGERLDAASRMLIAMDLQTPPAPSTFAQWLDESWQIALDSAYPPGNETVPTISATFYENSRSIANRRVALAGYRLAMLLNDLFGAPGKRD